METIVKLNEADFDRAVATAHTPVLVDFYASWCGPCKMLAPVLERLAEQFAGRVQFFKVNVDEAPGLAGRFEISGVPTLMFFQNGEVRDTLVGFASPRALAARLEAIAASVTEARSRLVPRT